MDQAEFTDYFIEYVRQYYFAWIVEDKNYNFPDNYGPVGIIVARFNGWDMDPVFIPFQWITPKNTLKMIVGFFQMARYEKGIGILNMSSDECRLGFLKKVSKRYNVFYYVGKIPRGNRGDDKYMFYGRGKDFYKTA